MEVGGSFQTLEIGLTLSFIVIKLYLTKEAEAASNGCVQCLRFWPRRQKAVITSNKWAYFNYKILLNSATFSLDRLATVTLATLQRETTTVL